VGELTIDQIRHILDNAPEWAKGYNTVISQYVRSCWFGGDMPLSDLKAQVDQHYYGQSEEEELKQYAVLSHEKIAGGAMLVGEFNVNYLSKFAEYQDVIANQQSKIEQLEKEKAELKKRIEKAIGKWMGLSSIATTQADGLSNEFYMKLDGLHNALTGFDEALRGE
jgi:hypothetical protein